MQKEERTLHQLHYFFGNRAKDQRVPAGDAVRGDHDHVDVLALDDLHDVARDVIPNFDTGG